MEPFRYAALAKVGSLRTVVTMPGPKSLAGVMLDRELSQVVAVASFVSIWAWVVGGSVGGVCMLVPLLRKFARKCRGAELKISLGDEGWCASSSSQRFSWSALSLKKRAGW